MGDLGAKHLQEGCVCGPWGDGRKMMSRQFQVCIERLMCPNERRAHTFKRRGFVRAQYEQERMMSQSASMMNNMQSFGMMNDMRNVGMGFHPFSLGFLPSNALSIEHVMTDLGENLASAAYAGQNICPELLYLLFTLSNAAHDQLIRYAITVWPSWFPPC